MTTELIQVNPQEYGLDEQKAVELTANLPQITSERDALAAQYDEVVKLDIEAPETAKKARELRLKIRDNRTKGIEVWHKTSKDYFLKGGQFVDAIKRREIAINQRMEENLEAIEKHFENKENQRIAELNEVRKSQLAPFVESVDNLDLGNMESDVWDAYLSAKQKAYNDRIEAEKAAEEARIAAEKEAERVRAWEIKLAAYAQFLPMRVDYSAADDELTAILEESKVKLAEFQAEQQRIREENERLRKEAEVKQRELDRLQKEKEEAERKQREESERIEKQRIAAEKKAARAPDKTKLKSFGQSLSQIQLPELSTEEGKQIADAVKELLGKVTAYIDSKIEAL